MHPLKYLGISFVLFGVVQSTTYSRMAAHFRTNPAAVDDVKRISSSITRWLSASSQLGLRLIRGNVSCRNNVECGKTCEAFYNRPEIQIPALLARTSQPFMECLTRYSILHAEDRQAVIHYSAKFICDLGGANLYCKPGVVPMELKVNGPTCTETGFTASIKSLIEIECYYKCLIDAANRAVDW